MIRPLVPDHVRGAEDVLPPHRARLGINPWAVPGKYLVHARQEPRRWPAPWPGQQHDPARTVGPALTAGPASSTSPTAVQPATSTLCWSLLPWQLGRKPAPDVIEVTVAAVRR
jgi:hypothetical protein